MLGVETGDARQKNSETISISVPSMILNSLKREFSLTDAEIGSFVISLIEKSVMEHAAASESKVFSETETKELEDDLRGLGYI